ncbi:MAG: GTP 3',8-cyclase MoaA, partial [Campylobacterales bacterium]|nr:GTP 3',8-cyclase MoaA [Campylobacterales bacterium]
DEIVDILEYSKRKNVPLRFIEFMSNTHAKEEAEGLKKDEILEVIQSKYSFEKDAREFLGPATLYKMEDGYVFGIISPHDDEFCKTCNRIRLTAEGNFIPCLFYDDSLNVKKSGVMKSDNEIEKVLHKAVEVKPEKNMWSTEKSDRAFYKTGG